MLDSVFNLARSTSRVCDTADRKYFFTSLSLMKIFQQMLYCSWNCQEYSQANTNIWK